MSVLCVCPQVREHCLTQLNKALEENNRACSAPTATLSLGRLETAAVGLEYNIFLGVKSPQMYKLTVHKKVRSLATVDMEMLEIGENFLVVSLSFPPTSHCMHTYTFLHIMRPHVEFEKISKSP